MKRIQTSWFVVLIFAGLTGCAMHRVPNGNGCLDGSCAATAENCAWAAHRAKRAATAAVATAAIHRTVSFTRGHRPVRRVPVRAVVPAGAPVPEEAALGTAGRRGHVSVLHGSRSPRFSGQESAQHRAADLISGRLIRIAVEYALRAEYSGVDVRIAAHLPHFRRLQLQGLGHRGNSAAGNGRVGRGAAKKFRRHENVNFVDLPRIE